MNDNQKFTLWYLLIVVIAIVAGYILGYVAGLYSHPLVEVLNNTVIAGNNSIPLNMTRT